MMKVLSRVGAVIGAVVLTAGIVGTSAPAYADESTELKEAKRLVTAQINGRLAALKADNTAVDAASKLTQPHRATLTKLLADDVAGLTALKAKVAGETTRAAVRADALSMVNDYRVYLLVGPKVRLSIAGDLGTAVVPVLQQAHDRLAAHVAKAKQAGKDVGNAEALLADMATQLQNASAALAGKVDTLLAIRAGPDGQAIRNQLAPIRESLGSARTALRKAEKDARDVREILKGLGVN